MIEIKMTFATFAEASMALCKLAEGNDLLAEMRAARISDDAEIAATVTATTEPTKRTRRTKEQIAADEAAAKAAAAPAEVKTETAAPAETVDDDPFGLGGSVTTIASVPTFETRMTDWLKANDGKAALDFMRENLQRVVTKVGMDGCRKMMVDFGHPRVTEVPAEKYPALLALIDTLAA